MKKECGGCDCGRCGVSERASSIVPPHVVDPAGDALDSTCAAAFAVLGVLPIAAGAKELLTEIGVSLVGAFLAVGEEEWGTVSHACLVLGVFVIVGKPLRAFPILFAGRKLVEPVL